MRLGDRQEGWAGQEVVAAAPAGSAQSSFVKAGAALVCCGSAAKGKNCRVSGRSETGHSQSYDAKTDRPTLVYVSFQNKIKMVAL